MKLSQSPTLIDLSFREIWTSSSHQGKTNQENRSKGPVDGQRKAISNTQPSFDLMICDCYYLL